MEIALRVNIDFEEVLFRHQPYPHLNESLEFLAFWIDPRPILTHRKYSQEYLNYVEKNSNLKPRIKKEGSSVYWWGDLSHPEILKEIAKKSFAFNFFKEKWSLEGICAENWREVFAFLETHKTCLLKGEGKMSGRGHKVITQSDISILALKPFEKCIVEPLYERVEDVSALYVSEEDKYIFYKNKIDKKFQWRSNLIDDSFVVSPEWQQDLIRLKELIQKMGYLGPFSVDAFNYTKNNKINFYPGSEVNPRKTMGWVNYKLKQKYQCSFSLFGMEPVKLSSSQFEAIQSDKRVLVLSPADNKFLVYWYGCKTEKELNDTQKWLEEILGA